MQNQNNNSKHKRTRTCTCASCGKYHSADYMREVTYGFEPEVTMYVCSACVLRPLVHSLRYGAWNQEQLQRVIKEVVDRQGIEVFWVAFEQDFEEALKGACDGNYPYVYSKFRELGLPAYDAGYHALVMTHESLIAEGKKVMRTSAYQAFEEKIKEELGEVEYMNLLSDYSRKVGV